jgi:hypothetical protein
MKPKSHHFDPKLNLVLTQKTHKNTKTHKKHPKKHNLSSKPNNKKILYTISPNCGLHREWCCDEHVEWIITWGRTWSYRAISSQTFLGVSWVCKSESWVIQCSGDYSTDYFTGYPSMLEYSINTTNPKQPTVFPNIFYWITHH